MLAFLKKHGWGAIVGLFIGGVATFGATDNTDKAAVAAAQADKVAVLSQYVYAQARLGEVPTLNLSIASADDMTNAYVLAVANNNAQKSDPNLFTDLVNDAKADGFACAAAPQEVLPAVPASADNPI